MSTYDVRLASLEKDVSVMRQDMIYKLDETNSVVTATLGVVGVHGRDLKRVINQVESLDAQVKGLDAQIRGLSAQVKNLDIRLRVEMHLDRMSDNVSAIQEQQNRQGQDIRDIKHRLEGFDQRFDQVLQALTTLTNKP